MAKEKNHYVDNDLFYSSLVERKTAVDLAIKKGKEPPLITDYLGKCIFDICTHLSYKPNFINYSFRLDMVSDGIENCIEAIDKFDTVEYKKPFAYFTQIAFWAFLRRIEKEERQQYIKFKMVEEISPDEMIEIQDHDTGESQYRSAVDMVSGSSYFNTKEYEDKIAAKRKPKNAIIKALEEDDENDDFLHA